MNTDGGPAFPRPPFTPWTRHDNAADAGFASTGHPGMSLRDWFAGQAIMGWAAGRNRPMEHEACEPASVARSCYVYADAMLRARERGVEGGTR